MWITVYKHRTQRDTVTFHPRRLCHTLNACMLDDDEDDDYPSHSRAMRDWTALASSLLRGNMGSPMTYATTSFEQVDAQGESLF